MLQVSAQSFKSHFGGEREVEGWPGQCELVAVPRTSSFSVPARAAHPAGKGMEQGWGWARGSLLPPDTVTASGSFSWCAAIRELTFSSKAAPLACGAESVWPREAPLGSAGSQVRIQLWRRLQRQQGKGGLGSGWVPGSLPSVPPALAPLPLPELTGLCLRNVGEVNAGEKMSLGSG